ncbi:MAG: GDSL-type esterase/lipase family protein [Clostridia bacterium]
MKKKFLILVLVLLMSATFAVGLTACNSDSAYDTGKQNKMDNYNLLNETAKSGQAVMIGDSIVEIFPIELFSNVKLEVYNRGIGGDTSDRLLERLDKNALAIAPKVLSVLVGTNDLNYKISGSTVGNIKQIVEKAKLAGVPNVIVQSIYPVNKSVNKKMVGKRKNADIMLTNTQIKNVCDELNVTYLNVYDSLLDGSGNLDASLTYDGLHLNVAGFKIVANLLKPYFDI